MLNTDPASSGSSFTIPNRLHVDALTLDRDSLTISASVRGAEAHCPVCGETSRRVHGRYTRTLADLPWSGMPVRLRVRVRKFFCDRPTCERTIFAERLDEVARLYARSTDRQREALEWIAFALGGEAGARLARELGLLVSPDALLNRIRGVFRAEAEDVRVLGVDDFGFRKGSAPGTILVDLERHKVADLFEGHSGESIARWLRRHPGVEVVARDRSHVCREGINAGAPAALQVADRGHLLRSLALGLEEFLLRKRSVLGRAAAPERAKKGSGCPAPSTRTFRPCPSAWEGPTAASRGRHRSATSASSSGGRRSEGCTWWGRASRT